MSTPIKVVVFDAFNTIVKREREYITEPYKLVTERATKPLFNPMASNLSLREYAEAIGAIYTDKEWIKIEGDLQIELDHITDYDDVKFVMHNLKKRGIIIAIGSNLAPEYGPKLKEIFGELVNEYYYSYEMQLKKPQTEYYQYIESDIQKNHYRITKPSDFFMVGDSFINDYLTPRKLGWNAMHLDRHGQYDTHDDRIMHLDSIFMRI